MELVYEHETPDAGVLEAAAFVNNLFPMDGFWMDSPRLLRYADELSIHARPDPFVSAK